MDSQTRYEILQNEEEEAAAPPAIVTTVCETEVEEEHLDAAAQSTTPLLGVDKVPEPPPYDIATDLPTYEEAERTKLEEENNRRQEDAQQPQVVEETTYNPELGTDGIFLCTFVIAFLFNWLGLLASLCLFQTVAGRFGALAGFGLSLVKWVAIVKHNNWAGDVAGDDSWLWWLLILLGFLIFFRGCLQYIRVKYQWQSLSAQVRRRFYAHF